MKVEFVSVIQINLTNGNIYYTRNINFLDNKIVFINLTGGSSRKTEIPYTLLLSVSNTRVDVDSILP